MAPLRGLATAPFRATLLLLVAVTLPAALGAPKCSDVKPGAGGKCPAACKSTLSRAHISFDRCKECVVVPMNIPQRPDEMFCRKCKAGFHAYDLDSFQTECLRASAFQCAKFDKELPGSANSLSGPCATCASTQIALFATNYGNWEFADGYYSAKRICRTCGQLGCKGLKCKSGAGCGSCPPGSALLQTGPPVGTTQWIGENDYYWVGKSAPTLPKICLRIKEDLGCAVGKVKYGVGCTACPAGKKLQKIKPRYLAGSSFIHLQPVGKACY